MTPKELGDIITEYCRNKVEALGEVESDDETAEHINNPEEDNVVDQDDDVYNVEKKKTPVHFEVTLTVSLVINFLKGCPLNAGNPTPNCDLQISLGKTRHVSTNPFMLRGLWSDGINLHPARHLD